jgi:hypothetical protein
MAHFIPTKDDIDAKGTMVDFHSKVVRLDGLLDDIVSDSGITFTSHFTRKVMEVLKTAQQRRYNECS